jgi:hypothetical protein
MIVIKLVMNIMVYTVTAGFLIRNLLSIWEPNGVLTPSECCSHLEFCHPRAAFQQRSIFIDRGGFLPYPRSWPWHSRLCQRAQRLKWWSFLWEFWRKSTYLLSIWAPSEEWTLSEYCSHLEFCHPRAAFQQRSISIDRVGYLLCPKSWPWHSRLYQRAQHPE